MSYDDTTPVSTTRRPVKVAYLVIGLLFVGIAGIWALGASDTVKSEDMALWSPALLILAGAAGLVAVVVNSRAVRRRRQTDQDTYANTIEEDNDNA